VEHSAAAERHVSAVIDLSQNTSRLVSSS